MAALWRWPGRVLRWNLLVVMVDLIFALVLIHFREERAASSSSRCS
jgi:hypothetical protein